MRCAARAGRCQHPHMAAEHDTALVRRARSGDRSALDELVRRHQARVYTLVRGIVRHDEDAADVAQETWIAVVRHLDTFREGALFTTWLHRIAVRKCYDALRRRVPEPVDPATGAAATLPGRVADPQAAGVARSGRKIPSGPPVQGNVRHNGR